jgi:transposase, IS6 family
MLYNSFKWKHFVGEIILLNVRWYLKYPLSYRNLEEMMTEIGVKVDHTTIMRWVYQYSPEIGNKVIHRRFDFRAFSGLPFRLNHNNRE